MALYFFTGFEGCGDAKSVKELLDGAYNSTVSYGSVGGYNNSKCINTFAGMAVKKNLPVAGLKTVGAGFHKRNNYYSDNTNSSSIHGGLFRFYIGSTYIIIQCFSTGWKAYKGGYSDLLGQSSNFGYIQDSNSIVHFECKIYSHATSGSIRVKVNGSIVLDLNNINTDGGDITSVWWGSNYLNGSYNFDNLYLADDLQGELYSQVLRPNSDGDVNQFTPLSGSDNYAMVDDITIDYDSTYVMSNTVGHKDLFNFQALTLNNNTIKGVSLITYARKTSGVFRSIQNLSKQDSVERTHNSRELLIEYPDSHTGYALVDGFGVCPDGTSWTVNKLNAMQWGFTLNG